jgi:dolichyl-phosphate beta-glucosyltransferase
MPQNLKLSVVIPAYNEGKRISATLEDIDQYLARQHYDYEIIVVDNGSNDNTSEIVKNEQGKIKGLNLVRFEKSVGAKGSAVKLGILEHSHGDYVVFMDADNATPVSEMEKFWPYLEYGQAQVVIGSRYVQNANVTEKQPFYRIFLSRIGNLLTRFLVDPTIKDTQLGFKAFTQKAAREIFSRVTILGWGFDMEVLTIAKKHGFKVKEVGVLWRERGGSHVPLKGYIETLLDLLKIKLNAILGKYDR